jgi:hypothetical protein
MQVKDDESIDKNILPLYYVGRPSLPGKIHNNTYNTDPTHREYLAASQL